MRAIESRPPRTKLYFLGGREIVVSQIRPPDGCLAAIGKVQPRRLASIRIAIRPFHSSRNRLRANPSLLGNSSRCGALASYRTLTSPIRM
jgi:hypothetical protein